MSLLELFTEPTVAGLVAAIDRVQARGQTLPVPAIVPVARQRQRAQFSSRGELLKEAEGHETDADDE